ncbi:DUF2513 domain-containing protein [Paracoccus alkenifer]|nr:DUF2513 domain-containing protein [Paracoccus alkenifer]
MDRVAVMGQAAQMEYLLMEMGACPYVYLWGMPMRRDDDLIRRLMLDFEASQEFLLVCTPHNQSPHEERLKYYHLKLLADAGLLEESGSRGGIFRMTNAGHDFCAAIRDDAAWARTKAAAASVSGVGLSLLRDISMAFLRKKLSDLGVPLD